MKNHSFTQARAIRETVPRRMGLDGDLARILARVQDSGRSAVKSALRELRNLANSINTSLMRSYEADQIIRERKEKLVQQRFYL